MRARAIALALALAAAQASAEEGVRLDLLGTATAGFTADDQEVVYGGRLAVDGPIAGSLHQLRLGVEVDFTGVSGEAPDVSDLSTWGRGVRVRAGVRFVIAAREDGITVSAYAAGGFLTALHDTVLDRYLRELGFGVEFAAEMGGTVPARFRVGYCRSEEGGYIGFGQVCLAGHVPLGFTKGAMVLGGDAILNLSRASVTPQHDALRLYVGVSLPEVVKALRD